MLILIDGSRVWARRPYRARETTAIGKTGAPRARPRGAPVIDDRVFVRRSEFMGTQRPKSSRRDESSRRAYEQIRSMLPIQSSGEIEYYEADLISAFSATRNSIRRCLQMLAEDGLVIRQRGVGTAGASQMVGVNTGLEFSNAETSSGKNRIINTPSIMLDQYGQIPGRMLVHEERSSFAGDPLYLRISYVPLYPERPLISESDYWAVRRRMTFDEVFLGTFGDEYGSGSVTIDAVPALQATADALDVPEGWPTLLRERVLRDASGRVREVSFTYFRGDRVALTSTSAPAPRAS